ncbi:MAG: 1-deoxy-D-xylulose-5-phosphate reductoisomerase [Burkholderiales bacterium RIFCSPLOWO2_12_FULL_61_40]|nr:MAG: 1-deoxy-D-xylulose-5-phosphate reductoisomerase [Burkholderiales bacterium RIFCSPLOWO2_12_FULL_61_40]
MKFEKSRVVVLGSTGSIGVSTLDVIERHPDRFEVFALTASTSNDLMLAQCIKFKPTFAVMASETHGLALEAACQSLDLRTRVLWGGEAIEMVAGHELAHVVMAAIVGAAGLAPCLAAARTGKRLLLANKEALVVGGQLFLDTVVAGGATLLPIDSEHSAIFQSLPENPADWASRVDKIILTASGGPFRTRAPQTLRDVTPEEACAHPNWVMGRKISVDSATMMNKALEVIEAKFLFGLAPQKIEVVIHPQSVIHSMVQYVDNSVVAQLGTPDMRGPIAYGLSWPHRVSSGASALDFSAMSDLSFEAMNSHDHPLRFPGLALAWAVLDASPGTTAVLNAANEVAVAAFLARRIRFDQIHHVNAETLDAVRPCPPGSLADLLALDQLSRQAAEGAIQRFSA